MLARHFHARGHTITVLSRRPSPAPWRVAAWDGRTPGDWIRHLEQSDVCINLAGRSVNCRYTPVNRTDILESRVRSTLLLNEVIGALKQPPRVWLNASTATIYRHALDRAMDEVGGELGGSEPGAPDTWNFSIDVAKRWEHAFFGTPTPLTRKIAMRSAITFSPDRGGAFDVLSALARKGLGGAQGSGRQFVSWIHEADFARAVELLISREDLDGVVNLASPNPLPNADFMRALRKRVGRSNGTGDSGMDDRIGRFSEADRVGTGSEKPARCARPPCRGWFRISLSSVGGRRPGSCCRVAEPSRKRLVAVSGRFRQHPYVDTLENTGERSLPVVAARERGGIERRHEWRRGTDECVRYMLIALGFHRCRWQRMAPPHKHDRRHGTLDAEMRKGGVARAVHMGSCVDAITMRSGRYLFWLVRSFAIRYCW